MRRVLKAIWRHLTEIGADLNGTSAAAIAARNRKRKL